MAKKRSPNKQVTMHVFDPEEVRQVALASLPISPHYNPEVVARYFEKRHGQRLKTARDS